MSTQIGDGQHGPNQADEREMREMRLAQEAIAMVASGASTRVVVAGIAHGDDILDAARRMALQLGVRVNPLRDPTTGRADLVVEPIYD